MFRISIPSVEAAAFALICGVACVAVDGAPDAASRHTVPVHFNVPHPAASAPSATSGPANVVTNGGFESGKIDGGWYQCGDADAYITREHPFGGVYDEYSGTATGRGEPPGSSGVCQAVTVPIGGVLTAQLYQLTDESDTRYAYQEADLLDDHGNMVLNLYKAANDVRRWVQGRWNLGAYAGRTYWLYFGVTGDGNSNHSTQQFVDDIILTGSSSSNAENQKHETLRARAGTAHR